MGLGLGLGLGLRLGSGSALRLGWGLARLAQLGHLELALGAHVPSFTPACARLHLCRACLGGRAWFGLGSGSGLGLGLRLA